MAIDRKKRSDILEVTLYTADGDPFIITPITERAFKALHLAHENAGQCHQALMDTEHLLLGLLQEGTGVAVCVIKHLGGDTRELIAKTQAICPGATPKAITDSTWRITHGVKQVLEYAAQEQSQFKHNFFGTEHLLLGLLRTRDSQAADVLLGFGITFDKARTELGYVLGYAP